MITAKAAYLLAVEEVYRQPTLAGWEHYNSFAASDVNQRPRALERRYVNRSALLFWLLLLGAAIVFALVAWSNLVGPPWRAAVSTRLAVQLTART
jgi:hypothetical protein